MSRVLKHFYKIINKNHIAMILVLMIIFVFPFKINAANKDYSKFDWDTFYAANNHYWRSICDGKDKDCNDSILYYQKAFYTKLYKLLADYQQKGIYINDLVIITTSFFELLPDYGGNPNRAVDYKQFFSAGTDTANRTAIKIDDDYTIDDQFEADESKIQEQANSFADETDTIKMLLKNSVAYYTYCYGSYGAPVTKTAEDGSTYKECPSGSAVTRIIRHKGLTDRSIERCAINLSSTSQSPGNELGFKDYYLSRMYNDTPYSFLFSFFGVTTEDDYLKDCEARKDSYPDGTYYVYVDQSDKSDPFISYTRYFDFLKTSRYFDNRPHLQGYFNDVLKAAGVDCVSAAVCSNSLEAKGLYETYEDMLEDDRLYIIKLIISLLNSQGVEVAYQGYGTTSFVEADVQTAVRSGYYWPIGGEEITEENNIKYAKGKPTMKMSDVESYFGSRKNPITGASEIHYGVDIKTVDGVTNVIAAYNGVVTSVINGCTVGDYTCNDGYGNQVVIGHNNGDYTVYAHLASIDPQIIVGNTVLTGELIGKAGSTGATKSSNLHYELRVGGNSVSNAVDPLTATPAGKSTPPNDDDLRPSGYSSSGYGARSPRFSGTNLTKAEFVGLLTDYCNKKPKAVAKEMCNNPETVYETSKSADVNPELVIVRAISEGNSPGESKHNYWGIRCYNGQPSACSRYDSLESGIRGFSDAVKNYDTLAQMMSKYAYIGRNWYNPGSWSDGGCKYLPLIKEFMTPTRQSETEAICAKSSTCTTKGGDCTPTKPEDQDAYATWQVTKNMGPKFYNIFGT